MAETNDKGFAGLPRAMVTVPDLPSLTDGSILSAYIAASDADNRPVMEAVLDEIERRGLWDAIISGVTRDMTISGKN